MITLLSNVDTYCPNHIGIKDILIAFDKILKIGERGEFDDNKLIKSVVDCTGKIAVPGIIDQHVHIIGGGGEQGPISNIPEIKFMDIIDAGVTTVVGVLGVNSCTKSLSSLLYKALALEAEGITTYIYTGSYNIPTTTFTGEVATDIAIIDKVIGAGEVAISDHRSILTDNNDFAKLCLQAHIGGLIGSKAGVTHIHVGEGKKMLEPVFQLFENTEIPYDQIVPTHINRSKDLFEQAIKFASMGGHIDLTAGENNEYGLTVPDGIAKLIGKNIGLDFVTVSSDANGSIPIPVGSVGRVKTLFDDIINCIMQKNVSIETAFKLVTENVAKLLKIYPKKGTLQIGSDADIVILNKDLTIDKVFAKGINYKNEC